MKFWKLIFAIAGGILLAVFVLSIPRLFVFFGPKPEAVLIENPGQAPQTGEQDSQLRHEVDSVFNDGAKYFPVKKK